MSKYIKHVILLFVAASAGYTLHRLALSNLDLTVKFDTSGYQLVNMYLLGFISSLVVAIVIWVSERMMPSNLGSAFLVAISLKVLVFYIYIYKGLEQANHNVLKYSFMVVFFLFLLTDVWGAFKALNTSVNKH